MTVKPCDAFATATPETFEALPEGSNRAPRIGLLACVPSRSTALATAVGAVASHHLLPPVIGVSNRACVDLLRCDVSALTIGGLIFPSGVADTAGGVHTNMQAILARIRLDM